MNILAATDGSLARIDRRGQSDEVVIDERLVERARSALAELGFPLVAVAVVYGMTGRFVVIDGERADGSGREALRVASDPVISAARRSVRPITWIGPGSRLRLGLLDAFGLRFGVTVPVHGPLGMMVLVSVAGRPFAGGQEALEIPKKLRAIGFSLLDGFGTSDEGTHGKPLSNAQRETVRMIAGGYSLREVARIEGVSDIAVAKRIERAKNAIGARSTSELVARVLVSGELGAMHLDGL